MTDFSSFFPSGGGGGGGVIINNFQTGSAAIEFDQLQALAIVASGYQASEQAGNFNIDPLRTYYGDEKGEGDFQLTYPEDVLNTYTTIKNVTNATNGGAFCYASFLHRSNNNVSGNCGGDISFKVTLDGTAHVVNYKPTDGATNRATSICQLGYATVRNIESSSYGGAIETMYPYIGSNISYGTFWDASLVDVGISSQNTYIGGIGTTGTGNITVPLGTSSLILDSNGKALFSRSGGIRLDVSPAGGQFGADGNPNTTGFGIASDQTVAASASNVGYVISADGLTLQYHTTFSQNDGQGTLTITGTTIDTSANTATISFSRTSPSTNGRARIGNIQFQGQQSHSQQTVRSSNYNDVYSNSSEKSATHFHNPKDHVKIGYPWVKFDTSCKVEMSHSAEPSNYSYNGVQQCNVGIYEF